MAANSEQRADQMRTHSDADQEPPVTQPPTPGERAQRSGKEGEETDEIGNPMEHADEEEETPVSQGAGASH